MIRLLVRGRFGNQLFQYAAVRAQAKRLGVELEIDLQFCNEQTDGASHSFWLDTLPIRARVIRYPTFGPLSAHSVLQRGYRKLIRPVFWNRYVQPLWEMDSRFFGIKPWTVVSGYFQSLFYLLPRDDEILSELSLCTVATTPAIEYAKSIGRESSVSVHVRRGDAVMNQGQSDLLPAWQSNHLMYFDVAMSFVRKKLGNPTFFIFSDDTDWCKRATIFHRGCEFVEANKFGENPAIDLLLMSSCHHHIITNSTYSWWAAWAAYNDEKICVLPKHWTGRESTASIGLVCQNWVTL